jgi:hypothetical protein
MLASSYEVTDVLLLVGNVGPIALYFLFLGLVNSHSRPCLVTCRSDFISLTIVLVPLLMWPVPMFARSDVWWLGLAGFLFAGVVFLRMLPSSGTGFVIYNISESRCRRLLADSIQQLGWKGHWQGHLWHGAGGRMTIWVRGFALLRNVTVHVESAEHDRRLAVDALYAELDSRLRTISQLPSTMGACLVVLGVGLLIIPMWMVGRNIDALVDAMSWLFG